MPPRCNTSWVCLVSVSAKRPRWPTFGQSKLRAAMSTSTKSQQKSYLDLARGVDAVPYRCHEPKAYEAFIKPYYAFKLGGYNSTFGLLPEKVVKTIQWPKFWTVDHSARSLTLSGGTNLTERSELFSQTLHDIIQKNDIPGLDNPKGELLPTFGADSAHVLNIDRSAANIFGTVSYGVQMLAYTSTPHGLCYWVPRRSKTKRSYPGMLDNCVGGALDAGETPLTCLIREASEEASLPEDYVREHAKPFGVVSYWMGTNANGEEGHQPQVMYVYHIELSEEVVPEPSDGEVEGFELMRLEEVQGALREGLFKTNCAATWIEYLIAIGEINAQNEPDLHRIVTHLHRRLDFPVK